MHKIKKCVISNVALICFGLGLASCNNSRNTSGKFLNESSLKTNDLSESEEKIFSAIKYSLYAFEKPETVELTFVSEIPSFVKIKFLGQFDGYFLDAIARVEFNSDCAYYAGSFFYHKSDLSDDYYCYNKKEDPFWFFVNATNDLISVDTSGHEEIMEKYQVADYSVSVPKINEELDKLRNL